MLTYRQYIHAIIWVYRLLTRKNYPVELNFIKKSLTSEDVCIDVGAHSGIWSYPLSKVVNHVYAFEALPYYAEVLGATVNLLGVKNITVVNKAASDLPETVSLIWRDTSGRRLTGFTHIAGASEQPGNGVGVAAVPLDSYIGDHEFTRKRVAFIKCDVEGYECQVMLGARHLIARWHPLILAEAKDAWFRRYGKTSTNLFEILTSYGYVGSIFRPDGSLQEITAASYLGSGDILFRPIR